MRCVGLCGAAAAKSLKALPLFLPSMTGQHMRRCQSEMPPHSHIGSTDVASRPGSREPHAKFKTGTKRGWHRSQRNRRREQPAEKHCHPPKRSRQRLCQVPSSLSTAYVSEQLLQRWRDVALRHRVRLRPCPWSRGHLRR